MEEAREEQGKAAAKEAARATRTRETRPSTSGTHTVPMYPPPPNRAHDAPPQTPLDGRGDFRGDDDRHQDHGMYSGDDY